MASAVNDRAERLGELEHLKETKRFEHAKVGPQTCTCP